jgi:hypothetical protein
LNSDITSSYVDATHAASNARDAAHASSSVAAKCTKPANSTTLARHLFIEPKPNSLPKMLQMQLQL